MMLSHDLRGRRLAHFFICSAATLCAPQLASPAQAADWVVRAQANGGAWSDTGYGYCGSSDHAVDCASSYGNASGAATYSNGDTTIVAQGQSHSDAHPDHYADGKVTADLGTATIRQANSSIYASSGTAGTLVDQLTFSLADPNQVYVIAFTYNFDGGLSGDRVPSYGPGLYAQSYLSLGYASIGSTQGISYSGDYNAPVVSVNNGSGQWTNLNVTQSMYGYSVTGDVLIGGSWGNVLGFNMQSQVSCGNEYGSANCDFSHTQAFDFGNLPDGVSYTSASGVFLTAPATAPGVPETSTWALMIAGLGVVGSRLRKGRRQRYSSAS